MDNLILTNAQQEKDTHAYKKTKDKFTPNQHPHFL